MKVEKAMISNGYLQLLLNYSNIILIILMKVGDLDASSISTA